MRGAIVGSEGAFAIPRTATARVRSASADSTSKNACDKCVMAVGKDINEWTEGHP